MKSFKIKKIATLAAGAFLSISIAQANDFTTPVQDSTHHNHQDGKVKTRAKKGTHEVGHGAKEVGKGTKDLAVAGGQAVGNGAKKAGKGAKKASKKVGSGVKNTAQKVDRKIDKDQSVD